MRLQEIQQAKSLEILSRSNPNISRVPSPREPRSHAAPPARAPVERFYFSLQTLAELGNQYKILACLPGAGPTIPVAAFAKNS